MKRIAYNTCLWFLSVIIFSATLECAARIEDKIKWNADLFSNYSSDILRCSDQYGVHSRFNTRYEKWQINSHGFRGPEIDFTAPYGINRIMCMGASETLGLYEQEGMEYPAQLRTILDKKTPRHFQVINAASLGTSIPKASQNYTLWLSKFKPDVVLYYPSPAFYLDESPPAPVKLGSGAKPQKNRFQFRISRKIELVLKKNLPDSIQLQLKQWQIYRQTRNHGSEWGWKSPPSDRLELFRSHLVAFIENISKSGARPVLLTHACRFSANAIDGDRYQLISWRKFYPRASEKCLIDMEDAANNIIREIGATYQVPVIDLDKSVPKGAENFADFAHFTDAGARIVAAKLADALVGMNE